MSISILIISDRRILRPNVDQWRKDIEALYEAVKTGGDYWRKQAESQPPAQSQSGIAVGGEIGDDGSMVLLASFQ